MGLNIGTGQQQQSSYGATNLLALLQQLQSGSSTSGLLSLLGGGNTITDPSIAAPEDPSRVGTGTGYAYPFDPKYLRKPIGSEMDKVPNDYPMPVGTQLFAAFDGTVKIETYQHKDGSFYWWGRRVVITRPDGTVAAYGHLSDFAPGLKNGDHIHAGQFIGLSGNVGYSYGPHLEFQLMRPGHGGQLTEVDAFPFLQQIFTGQNTLVPDVPNGYTTPDGHFIMANSKEDTLYQMASSVWKKIYGANPPWSVVAALEKAGVKNTDQLMEVLNGMPSSIPGVTIGQYEQVSSVATGMAQKYFGRPIPGSMVKEFFAKGLTTPQQIAAWFINHPASDIPKEDYQAIFDVANQWTNGVWDTTPHPDQVVAIAAAGGYTPPTGGVVIGAGKQAGATVQGPASHGSNDPPVHKDRDPDTTGTKRGPQG